MLERETNGASDSIPIFILRAFREKWTILECILECASARIAVKLIFDLWTNKHNRTLHIWLPLSNFKRMWCEVGESGCLFYVFFCCLQIFMTSNCLDSAQLLLRCTGYIWQCVAHRLPDAALKLFKLEALAYGHAIHINFKRVYFQINFFFLQHLSVQQVA